MWVCGWVHSVGLKGSTRIIRATVAGIARGLNRNMATEQTGSKQPLWYKPEDTNEPKLKLYNSLTRKKEEFIPLNGRQVLWYSCGPTVYDASHMGHARSYITFDILRRVMSDYFNYQVLYGMNITDIDDKIIKRARRNHLLADYSSKERSLAELVQHVSEALKPFKEKTEREGDQDKKTMLQNTVSKVEAALKEAGEVGSGDPASTMADLLAVAQDPLSAWLDSKYGSEVRDHGIFATLTRHWEEEFHKDMEALNVLPPDVLTRVSEFVPEVIDFVQKIVEAGFGYESNGSVYFDVSKFSAAPGHSYAKLVPEAVGDLQALAEGEGELSVSADKLQEKHSRIDFVLWKASKPGEPAWDSPWGQGRPGWHIECSVMACDILGEKADIHTGGVDLKFPHHDNEIAQAEARFGHDQWMSYFLHSGHLTIEGCKMSKSLKNFITIKDALRRYSSRQLRLAFLLHSWSATLDYSEQTMTEALHAEKMFNEFFLTVKDLIRKLPEGAESYRKFLQKEKELNTRYLSTRTAVHEALCNSIDTPQVMTLLRELVGTCNVYIADSGMAANTRLLQTVAQYVTHMLKVFGVIPSDQTIGFPLQQEGGATDQEAVVVPYVTVLAEFREQVRKIALETNTTPLLKTCDQLRDETLVELGVRLEDKDGTTTVKLVGKEAILKERERERQVQEERVRVKEEQRRKMEEARRQREAQAAIPPQEMFHSQTDKYSMFDEQGIPTHDASGQPLSDKQQKKLRKLWQAQEKKYQEFQSRSGAGIGALGGND